MPLGANANLDRLYARQRLVQNEASRIDAERSQLADEGSDVDRAYILDIEIEALEEEAAKLASSISDILDRDLQR